MESWVLRVPGEEGLGHTCKCSLTLSAQGVSNRMLNDQAGHERAVVATLDLCLLGYKIFYDCYCTVWDGKVRTRIKLGTWARVGQAVGWKRLRTGAVRDHMGPVIFPIHLDWTSWGSGSTSSLRHSWTDASRWLTQLSCQFPGQIGG